MYFGHSISHHIHPGDWAVCRDPNSEDRKLFYRKHGVARNWGCFKTMVVRKNQDQNRDEINASVPPHLRTFPNGPPDIWKNERFPEIGRALSIINKRCVHFFFFEIMKSDECVEEHELIECEQHLFCIFFWRRW